MKTINLLILIIILIFSCSNEKAKSNEKVVKENEIDSLTLKKNEFLKDYKMDEGEPKCIYKKSNKIKLKTYPFDNSNKIEIISFFPSSKLKIINNKLEINKINERITLNNNQIDTLFSKIFDYDYKRNGNFSALADCYNPRHAIVFYKNNIPFDFLEICFECDRYKSHLNKIHLQLCSEKMCLLERFFESCGIKQGLDYRMVKCFY